MTATRPSYETVFRLLRTRTGLSFPPSRRESAEMNIRLAMARAGVMDPDRYPDLLATNEKALDELIIDLTVGETYFFREPAHFEFIRREVLPEIRRRRGENHAIRVWSAGCASGEEAYSLAIVLEEDGLAAGAHLLATDISRKGLALARAAAYGAWSMRGDGAAAALPYLGCRKGRYVIQDRIRRRVSIEHLNLALDVYPSFATDTWGMDLILCRNVLIYFDQETTRKVARRLFESLAPGGWLITAPSDPPLGNEAPFETIMSDAGVVYRRGIFPAKDFGRFAADLLSPETDPVFSSPSPKLPDTFPQRTFEESRPTLEWLPKQDDDLAMPAIVDPLTQARKAFAEGDYALAAQLTRGLTADVSASALHVRSLANLNTFHAELACADFILAHPLSTELHYLHAVLHLDLGQVEAAAAALRRVIYLDRSLAIAHFTLGSLLERQGDSASARRAYRNARDLCAARPVEEILPLAEGGRAGRLFETASIQLEILDSIQEGPHENQKAHASSED